MRVSKYFWNKREISPSFRKKKKKLFSHSSLVRVEEYFWNFRETVHFRKKKKIFSSSSVRLEEYLWHLSQPPSKKNKKKNIFFFLFGKRKRFFLNFRKIPHISEKRKKNHIFFFFFIDKSRGIFLNFRENSPFKEKEVENSATPFISQQVRFTISKWQIINSQYLHHVKLKHSLMLMLTIN